MTTSRQDRTARRDAPAVLALPRLITVEELAEHLGVSVRHVRRLVFERRIPYVKWGHLVRFDIDDVTAWLAESRVAAVNDSGFGGRR